MTGGSSQPGRRVRAGPGGAAAVAIMQGPLPDSAPPRAGRGPARPIALRQRPGEPRLPLLADYDCRDHTRDHEEHGVRPGLYEMKVEKTLKIFQSFGRLQVFGLPFVFSEFQNFGRPPILAIPALTVLILTM